MPSGNIPSVIREQLAVAQLRISNGPNNSLGSVKRVSK